jgi:hypothetical protein
MVQAEREELDEGALRQKKDPPVALEGAEGTDDATYKLSALSSGRDDHCRPVMKARNEENAP